MKDLQDNAPPTGAFLSGSYIRYFNAALSKYNLKIYIIHFPYHMIFSFYLHRSFAYKTLKDRLPIIVTGVIDGMSRNKESIIQKYGPVSMNIRHL